MIEEESSRVEELERLQRWREAIDAWIALARRHPNEGFLLRAAYVAVDAEWYPEAETLLMEIINEPSLLPDPYFELGRVRWKQNRLEEAKNLLTHGLNIEERQPILTILGGIYRILGEEAMARTVLSRSLELESDDDEAHYELGQTELTTNPQAAVVHFRRAIEIDPTLSHVWRQLGEALWRSGQLDEAEQVLRRTLELDAGDPLAHDYLGHILGLRREWAAAKGEFTAASSLDPTVGMFWRNLGDACSMLEHDSEAERCYLKSLSLEIDNAHANARYGLFLTARGRLEHGVKYLRRALELDPDQKQARRVLDGLEQR